MVNWLQMIASTQGYVGHQGEVDIKDKVSGPGTPIIHKEILK